MQKEENRGSEADGSFFATIYLLTNTLLRYIVHLRYLQGDLRLKIRNKDECIIGIERK